MDLSSLLKALEQFYPYLTAGALALARITSMMSVMPAFTRLGLTGILQTGVALAFSVPLIPLLVDVVAAEPVTIGRLAVLVLKEAALGITIGVALGVPIWAAEAAGDIVDLQRGSTLAGLLDPSAATETSVTGTLFAVVLVAMFYATGGLQLILRTVYDSYGIWPVGSLTPILSADTGRIVLSLLDDLLSMGVMLAVPLILAMLLTDFCLALVARAAPHMHVFDLSLSIKSFVFVLLLVLYSAFLFHYMEYDLRWLVGSKDRLELLRGISPQ